MTDNELEETRSADELISAYRDGGDVLRSAVAGMSPDQLLAKPIEGKMSSLEVVCHVADAEQFLADRMKRTIALEQPLLVGVEGWFYVDALHYKRRDVELDLALVDATRSQMAGDLDRLDASAWQRTAIHTEIGLVTLRDILVHAIEHLEDHVVRIVEKRDALGV